MPKSKNGGTRDKWKKPVRSDQIYSNNSAMNPIITAITASQVKKDITPFKVGDGVRVHTKVREGDKERVQVYAGIVIARKGHGIHESFTVRRISYGEGVERVFPVNSPNIDKVEVERESEVMKARLYYLRGRTGKAAVAVKVKDRSAEIHAKNIAEKAATAAAATAAATPAPAVTPAPAAATPAPAAS
jgi:large subunit ribosomal protein L19